MIKNLDKINSIKRDKIEKLVNNKEFTKYVKRVQIFGSSITDHCRPDSDIDFYITMKPEYINEKDINTMYNTICWTMQDGNYDMLLWHEQQGMRCKKMLKAMEDGVIVYEED